MANFIVGIISLTLGVVVLSGVFITTVKGTNTTGWTSGETALLVQENNSLSSAVGTFDNRIRSWSCVWCDECLWPGLIA